MAIRQGDLQNVNEAINVLFIPFFLFVSLLRQCGFPLIFLITYLPSCQINRDSEMLINLINDPRMFNGAIVDLAEKPYIQQKIILQ